MAKGYWIGRVDVSDSAAYEKYKENAAHALRKYGAKFLVRGAPPVCVEGKSKERNVVVEFEDYQTAVDCYNSAEYQAAKLFRANAGEVDLILIEGI